MNSGLAIVRRRASAAPPAYALLKGADRQLALLPELQASVLTVLTVLSVFSLSQVPASGFMFGA
jgi:type IV secretory pathway TrbD component